MHRLAGAVNLATISILLTSLAGPGQAAVPSMQIKASDLQIEGDLGSFKAQWSVQQPEPDLMLATLTLESPTAATPPAINIKWSAPAINVTSIWVSDYNKQKIGHEFVKIQSRAVQR
ncbi:MAG: hypothetical protein HKP20_06945, partial [Akkermansiaceae bacterium]|nr:hypothetical protein [Akkermansiaceae bacterium]